MDFSRTTQSPRGYRYVRPDFESDDDIIVRPPQLRQFKLPTSRSRGRWYRGEREEQEELELVRAKRGLVILRPRERDDLELVRERRDLERLWEEQELELVKARRELEILRRRERDDLESVRARRELERLREKLQTMPPQTASPQTTPQETAPPQTAPPQTASPQSVESKIKPPKTSFARKAQPETDDIKNATCSLNLVCYRNGKCHLHQIRILDRSQSRNQEQLEDPALISEDKDFFIALRNAYLRNMCSMWRRLFSMKTLRVIRLLSFNPESRPSIVPLDDFVLQEIFFAYQHPSMIETKDAWIKWAFRLRQPQRRHALEFVEGWDSARIAIAGTLPFLISALVGILWSIQGGDVQTAFAVAAFILTSGTLLLALLAIISGIESSGAIKV